ncbi:MAG: MMPL family transporter [Actinomycetota bacterium]
MSLVADLVLRRPRTILVVFVALLAAGAWYGRDVTSALSPAGYEVSGSESTAAQRILAERFDTGAPNIVLLVDTERSGGVDDPEVAAAADDVALLLAGLEDVSDVAAFSSSADPSLRSADGRYGLVTARAVASETEVYDIVEQVREELAGDRGPFTVTVGGSAAANLEIVEESERDLLRAELIAIPITTLIMLLVFRSVIAALLPLVVAAVAVIGTAAALRGLTEVTLISVFALNLTTALGLGMGIDFSLFTISRWREERAAGAEPDEALRTTIEKAGRGVLFSGLTTAATLSALLLFDYPLLRSLAFAGFVVVLLATLGALFALPATIAVLGDRVERFRLRPRREPRSVEDGRWFRLATAVMARPRLAIIGTVAVLLLLGAPFLRAEFGIPDDRSLPETSSARQVGDVVRSDFDGSAAGVLAVVAPTGPVAEVELDAYAARISALPGVELVDTVTGIYAGGRLVAESLDPDRYVDDLRTGVWLAVLPEVEPISAAGEALVDELRSLESPVAVLVGGESARLVDNKAEIRSKVVPVGLWVAAVVWVLLFWSFRSLLLPLKAVVLNLLSLTAAFGAIVWIFQDGRLTGLLGFTPTGLTDAQTPVLIFCIAFGLSMDYEVFLLSRIKEEWDRTGDTERAVAVGLERTGGIITAAAVLMAVVFLSFASGQVTFIQLVGIGLALAILADATLVRSLLVPAFMVVAGRWNWWSPWARSAPPTTAEIDVERPLVAASTGRAER